MLYWVAFSLGILLLSLFCLLPLLGMITTSLKTPDKYYASNIRFWAGLNTLAHYRTVLSDMRFLTYLKNSLVIAGFSTLIAVILGVTAGYGFSRYSFPAKKSMFVLILVLHMLPRAAMLIPLFIVFRQMRLIDTYGGLIFAYFILTVPLSVWLLRGFFSSVPKDIEEAARMDGSSSLGILLRIIVPISLPAILAVAMYSFVVAWNEFSLALTLSNTIATRPGALGLMYYEIEGFVLLGVFMAGATVMTIPSALIFLWFQRHLVQGLAEGALKG